MIFPPVTALSVVGVADASVGNSERLVLRPTEPVNLARFGVLVGALLPEGGAIPLIDNLFWFGDIEIKPPAWILLYTKAGTFAAGTHTDGVPIYSFFWGRPRTIFNTSNIVPIVFDIAAINVSRALNPVPPPQPDPSIEALRKYLAPPPPKSDPDINWEFWRTILSPTPPPPKPGSLNESLAKRLLEDPNKKTKKP